MVGKRGAVLNAILEDIKDSVAHVAQNATSPATSDTPPRSALRKEKSLPSPKSHNAGKVLTMNDAWADIFGGATSSPAPHGTPERQTGLHRAAHSVTPEKTGKLFRTSSVPVEGSKANCQGSSPPFWVIYEATQK